MSRFTEIVLASRNVKKLRELSEILEPIGVKVRSVRDFPDAPEVEETGETFFENAALKAETVAERLGMAVLADDSGLMVDCLGGEPGVFSARFSGENATDESNNKFLLEKMTGVLPEKRGAKFVCVLAFSLAGSKSVFFEGETKGRILEEADGTKGFGYDPLFFSAELGMTFAQAESLEKSKISHRGRAVALFMDWIKNQ